MERLYIAAAGATLRREDRRKAVEVAALLGEIRRAARGGRGELMLVDAAAGKAYVGLLAAKLVLEPAGRPARVIALERDARRRRWRAPPPSAWPAASQSSAGPATWAMAAAWPARPDVVVALHACGPASDAVLDRAIAAEARHLLLVPCCTGRGGGRRPPGRRRAPSGAASRATRPCAAASCRRWSTPSARCGSRPPATRPRSSSSCAPTVTPENLLWRARRVREPARMTQAQQNLSRLRGGNDLGLGARLLAQSTG